MTEWTPLLRDFIQQHLSDDTSSLLLSARKYPDIDVPFAASQIESRKRLMVKLPEWYANASWEAESLASNAVANRQRVTNSAS